MSSLLSELIENLLGQNSGRLMTFDSSSIRKRGN